MNKKIQPKKKKIATLQKSAAPVELPIPYDNLVGVAVTQPVLDEETMQRVNASIIPFTKQSRWQQWGMHRIKKQGTTILLYGKSGCGKTTVATYLAKKVSPGIIRITMADLGGSDPGATERNIKRVFAYGKEQGNVVIFIDECDAILWSREKAGPDSMWMLGVINECLMMIEKYEGLTILATNMKHMLDAALERRLSDCIEIKTPPSEVRRDLWWQKIPAEFPFQPTGDQLTALAQYELTGAQIESVIIAEAKYALQDGRKPTFQSICNVVKEYEHTDIVLETTKDSDRSRKHTSISRTKSRN